MLELSTRRPKEHVRTTKVNNYKNTLIMTNYSLAAAQIEQRITTGSYNSYTYGETYL